MAPRILVVDGNEAFATMLREMLAAEGGYEVDLAYKYYANFMIAPGGYEIIRDRAAALLRGLGP